MQFKFILRDCQFNMFILLFLEKITAHWSNFIRGPKSSQDLCATVCWLFKIMKEKLIAVLNAETLALNHQDLQHDGTCTAFILMFKCIC